jgi:hypothetical protein
MIRRWILGKDLMEKWQINALDLVDIVLYENLHVYEPDGSLAKYEHEFAIRANHPSPFSPLPKKGNPSIYELILNNEAYDFELPAILLPSDYIPLAKRIENYMFDLIEVKRIEKELNIIVHSLDKHVQPKDNINQTNVCDKNNERAVKESGSISDQLLENSGAGLFKEKSEAKSMMTESRTEENVFQNQGDFWKVVYQGEQLLPLKDSKGLHYLAILLQNPGKMFHVLHLIQLVNDSDMKIRGIHDHLSEERLSQEGLSISFLGDAGKVIDSQALKEYRQKIRELKEEIEEAENNNDFHRSEALRRDKEFLEQHILALTDVRGHTRKMHDYVDRARKAVTNAIKYSINKIYQTHPEFGEHLKNSIQTGTSCSYFPDKPISWEI